MYYIIRVRASFAALPRLETPWLVLAFGVATLFVAALMVPLSELSPSFGYSRLIQVLAAVLAAFFVLTAMVTMKRAWTIAEGD
jgi:protein-S-isoprenylcysteine O-methyltransferase Ste14